MFQSLRACLFLALALITAGSHAHGIWFAERVGELAFVYGEGAEDGAVLARQSKIQSLAVTLRLI